MKKLIGFIISVMPVVCSAQTPNSEYDDMYPTLMPDGLTLFICSNRPGGYGDLDIYICTRRSLNGTWSEPKNLGPDINTDSEDHSVTISEDGHWMLFFSGRKGNLGKGDLYYSY